MAGKYIYPGKVVVRSAVSLASPGAPTRGEINAALALSVPGSTAANPMRRMVGWRTEANNQATPDLSSRVISKIPGMKDLPDTSIEFYDEDAAASAIRSGLPEDAERHILIMHQGDVPGRRMEVWPVRVNDVNNNDVDSTADPALLIITFAVISPPFKSVTIPA